MNRLVPLRNKYRKQRGVTAIEFAILFPVFFAILYGIIQFGMIFAAQQTLTLAAEEGARAALQYQYADGTPQGSLTARATAAQTACESMVGWLSSMQGVPSSTICKSVSTSTTTCPNASMYCVTMSTSYPYASKPLIPTLALLNWVVPSYIGNTATVQIDPANII